MRRTLALLVVAALSTIARSGAAAESGPVAWNLDVDASGPQAGGCDRGRFVREVELACDAFGRTCVVAPCGPGARHAILHCGGEWVLEVHEADGTLLWTTSIPAEGDPMRRAATWIARAPSEALTDGPLLETDEAPPPAAVPAPLSPTGPATDVSRDAGGTVQKHVAPSSTRASGLLLASRASFVGGGFGPMLGGRTAAALSVASPNLALDVALAGGRTLSGPMGYGESTGRLGAGVLWGAPWGRAPVGFSLEGGALLGGVSAPSGTSPSSQTFVRAYGEAAFTAQWDGSRVLRPFATLSASAQSGSVSIEYEGSALAPVPWFSASLDVGVAWRSW